MSWEEAWNTGRTGWDAGEACPALVERLAQGAPHGEGRALVPGCGSGYDAFAFARAGYRATGLELSPTAAQRFEQVRAQEGLTRSQADIVVHDVFDYTPEQPFDIVWDYTFLCAIDPQRRDDWAASMHRLVAPGGQLWTLIFPVDPRDATASTRDDPGPPYRLHPEVVRALLRDLFEEISMEQVERSHAGREGKEWLAVWERKEVGQ